MRKVLSRVYKLYNQLKSKLIQAINKRKAAIEFVEDFGFYCRGCKRNRTGKDFVVIEKGNPRPMFDSDEKTIIGVVTKIEEKGYCSICGKQYSETYWEQDFY